MRRSAQVAVQKRWARCPMASPKVKYSNSASSVTRPTASATIAVEPHNTSPTAKGINTAAVATRFHVMEMESPEKLQASSHHIGRNKSRTRSTTDTPVRPNHGIAGDARWKIAQERPPKEDHLQLFAAIRPLGRQSFIRGSVPDLRV